MTKNISTLNYPCTTFMLPKYSMGVGNKLRYRPGGVFMSDRGSFLGLKFVPDFLGLFRTQFRQGISQTDRHFFDTKVLLDISKQSLPGISLCLPCLLQSWSSSLSWLSRNTWISPSQKESARFPVLPLKASGSYLRDAGALLATVSTQVGVTCS